jgi:hypothetical protein
LLRTSILKEQLLWNERAIELLVRPNEINFCSQASREESLDAFVEHLVRQDREFGEDRDANREDGLLVSIDVYPADEVERYLRERQRTGSGH